MTWLSIHFYPLETENVFLTRAVKPFLEQYIWPRQGARAFFVRYEDAKGRHIRLRLRGEADWLEETLRPALAGWFEGRGEWQEVAYKPETERFGGTDGLAWAEEFFHISTRVVLERIGRETHTYGDAMFDALRMHTMTAFAAGFKREKAGWYFGQLCDLWSGSFFPDEKDEKEDLQKVLKADFEKNFEPQQEALQAASNALWKALETEKFDKSQPEWLRWFRGNQLILKEFGENLDKVLPSLIHLTNNRLGVNNQDEVYLNYILSKVL
ncbi:MAG: thiopeptide-type bacteriocin biosynthesis protein [Saprospiraceae bacterium]